MSDVPLHRLYHHYSELPYSLRVLYTMTLLVLGLGYLFGLIYLFHNYAGRAGGNPMMLSYNDILTAYTGSGKASRLESALRGPMSTMLPPDEAGKLIAWVHDGGDRAKYETDIKPLLDADVFTLVRVSHIHLFGLTFIFFIMGVMYSHAYVRPVWFKCAVVALPFVAVVLDISSWYLTKLFHPFAWLVMLAGGLMGICFAFMWVTTMYQLWFSPTPAQVMRREGGDIPNVG
ncbi:MAG: hypothetical protein E6H74_02200 [Betaproteobacteria bacterium]|nr:MAG: hypothetical protein E6H74_02200 [Betaproteobacteria bacterium]